MTMTDRTEEFRGAVKVFRPTVTVVNNSGEAAASRMHSDVGYQKTSEFLQLASSVAVGFEGTSKLVSVCVMPFRVGWLADWVQRGAAHAACPSSNNASCTYCSTTGTQVAMYFHSGDQEAAEAGMQYLPVCCVGALWFASPVHSSCCNMSNIFAVILTVYSRMLIG